MKENEATQIVDRGNGLKSTNKQIVLNYIETVWNGRRLDEIDHFISAGYEDHSLINAIPPNRNGLRIWIENTSKAFDHKTTVETIVAEGDDVAVRVSFEVNHIGVWRGIEPTNKRVVVKGFRFFCLRDGKIVSHWALIDGEALQTALTEQPHGCAITK
jgi:predicted ester cyclase